MQIRMHKHLTCFFEENDLFRFGKMCLASSLSLCPNESFVQLHRLAAMFALSAISAHVILGVNNLMFLSRMGGLHCQIQTQKNAYLT